MDWPSLRKCRGSAGLWPEFMLLPFSWLWMCLQSLKECKKVAWGFEKHGRDLRKHGEGEEVGKTTRNEKDLGTHLRLNAPLQMLVSGQLLSQSAVSIWGKRFCFWRTCCLMWRPYQLDPFQKLFYQAVWSPRHSFHLPPQRPVSSVESVISKALPLAVPWIVPRNIVRGHYAGFRGWGTSVLCGPWGTQTPPYSQVSHSSTPRLAVQRWWEGAGSAGMHLSHAEAPEVHFVYLWLQSYYCVTAEGCTGWKMCLLKATFKWPQSKCDSLYLRCVSMSLNNENMR